MRVRLGAFASLISLLALTGCNHNEILAPSPQMPLQAPPVPAAPEVHYPSNGPDLVFDVARRFPDRLVSGISREERIANMEFLRDEVITTGICGGMELARNLKRGKGPHSIDAIAWRHQDGRVDVVDIASAYDDTGRELRLHWLVVAGPPGWDPFPAKPCQ